MIWPVCRNMSILRRQRIRAWADKDFRRVKRYQYEMMGIVYPQYAEKNILIEYGITEADK